MHTVLTKTKGLLLLAVVIAGLTVAALSARAISAGISPSLQTGTSPYTANWNLSWSGSSPFEVLFSYGDGGGLYWPSTTSTSHNASRLFTTCVDKNYYQALSVEDTTGAFANAGSRVNVKKGAFCLGE